MKKYLIRLLCIVWGGLLVACSYSPKEYIAWVHNPSNGLKKEFIHQGFAVEVQYKPTDYMLLTSSSADKSDRAALDSMQYYNLSLEVSKDFCQQMENNPKLRDYLSYGFQNDIYIQQGNDSLPCVLFHYERTLSMRCRASYIVGFKRENENKESERAIVIAPSFFSSALHIPFANTETPKVAIP